MKDRTIEGNGEEFEESGYVRQERRKDVKRGKFKMGKRQT
jgi:hypothetical protein